MSDINDNSNASTAGDNFFGQMIEAGVADEKFIREIVEMFLEEGNQSLDKLTAAFDAKEHDNVKLFAHKLKSSFLMFDMHDAHALAVKLEGVNADNLSTFATTLSELRKACEVSFDLLRKKYLGDA